ncbi:PREDICTED: protein SENSITIVITY TO RED LIGHT REDUCED 1-like [Brassica oleracea var. oleracea]|uniref:SRR1-like domain-containing protein n=1 Tax=Brassica oleracea var. oleracea TaxID=109376 RepID=A0A0D3AX34_BRAOL|nr:PREDICTED: protein SENSITIVITY TO RED LIGHT REDUCED 1-like [Brassica oleracea var. oleracea]
MAIVSSNSEWTEERHETTKPKRKGQEKEGHDLEIDHQREERLKQQMEISMKKIESSEFYIHIMSGSETQLQMVIYGIGSIESRQKPRFQMSIAILMKREFDWVGNNIEVFDPLLSGTESRVITFLGCTVLSVNEEARREVLKPTLFFMGIESTRS